jgi:hypothetical protein
MVDETIENGIGQGRIPDGVIPVLYRKLAGNNRGSRVLAIFKEF